jgi:tRNA isopentenyl-2-thiomethyl-A-37 hydroxylase MiaE
MDGIPAGECMTREDIMRMAQKVWSAGYVHERSLERFAALVAAHEREQCALVAEELRPSKPEYDQRFYDGCTFTAMAIRARGEK